MYWPKEQSMSMWLIFFLFNTCRLKSKMQDGEMTEIRAALYIQFECKLQFFCKPRWIIAMPDFLFTILVAAAQLSHLIRNMYQMWPFAMERKICLDKLCERLQSSLNINWHWTRITTSTSFSIKSFILAVYSIDIWQLKTEEDWHGLY